MRKIFLLTGFQNWGKTWLIQELFSRQRFYKGALYDFSGCSFCVMPQSNDDLGQEGYETAYQERMESLKRAGIKSKYLFSAFCPTKEQWNNSEDIIKNLYAKDEVILIPIEHKWCLHAKLRISEIMQYYSKFTNVTCKPLSEKDPAKKLNDLQGVVKSCLP